MFVAEKPVFKFLKYREKYMDSDQSAVDSLVEKAVEFLEL